MSMQTRNPFPKPSAWVHKLELDEFYEIRDFLHFTSPEGELVGSLSQHLRFESIFVAFASTKDFSRFLLIFIFVFGLKQFFGFTTKQLSWNMVIKSNFMSIWLFLFTP